MTIIVQNRRKAQEYRIPEGGEILWYGLAAAVPSGFVIDSYCSNVFVRGAAVNEATNTPAGDNSHAHTNPASTGAAADHTHAIGGGSTGGSSGTTTVYPTSNTNSAPSHSHSINNGSSGAAGAHSHTLAGAASADAYPPYKRLYWIKAIREVGLPIGGILMWDNPIAGRPNGCLICDGANSTPDLRNQFVYGAASDGDVNSAGGAETHVHANAATGGAGSHNHSLSVGTGGAPSNQNVSGYTAGTTVAAGGHTHDISGTSDSDANHTHIIGNTNTASSLPPYLKLYFVMRTE